MCPRLCPMSSTSTTIPTRVSARPGCRMDGLTSAAEVPYQQSDRCPDIGGDASIHETYGWSGLALPSASQRFLTMLGDLTVEQAFAYNKEVCTRCIRASSLTRDTDAKHHHWPLQQVLRAHTRQQDDDWLRAGH